LKRLIFDLDGTLTTGCDADYEFSAPNVEVIEKLKYYKTKGYEIVISTARNMRTHEGNVGKINKHTLPVILSWLQKHQVPFDEVYVGKPLCGFEGFYVDDKAIRPSEFCSLSPSEIKQLLDKET